MARSTLNSVLLFIVSVIISYGQAAPPSALPDFIIPAIQPAPAKEGEMVELDCGINRTLLGNRPEPVIRWWKYGVDGEAIELDNIEADQPVYIAFSLMGTANGDEFRNILTIASMTESDRGTYMCTVTTDTGHYNPGFMRLDFIPNSETAQ